MDNRYETLGPDWVRVVNGAEQGGRHGPARYERGRFVANRGVGS